MVEAFSVGEGRSRRTRSITGSGPFYEAQATTADQPDDLPAEFIRQSDHVRLKLV
jgi:hypothetical protein